MLYYDHATRSAREDASGCGLANRWPCYTITTGWFCGFCPGVIFHRRICCQGMVGAQRVGSHCAKEPGAGVTEQKRPA